MDTKRLIIISGVLAAAIIAAVVFWHYVSIRKSANSPSKTNQSALVSNPELERLYEQHLATILKPFWSTQNAGTIKNQILELRAPGKYLDLHLNLVLAFDLLERGQQAADQAIINQALEKLNKLKSTYPWLD